MYSLITIVLEEENVRVLQPYYRGKRLFVDIVVENSLRLAIPLQKIADFYAELRPELKEEAKSNGS